MNWNRAYSLNAGVNWTRIPDDNGPADAPFFCCDQDVIHDHGRDVTMYSVLYVDSALTTGALRLYVRNRNNKSDSCSYTFDPGSGTLLDYPHLGLGNNYIYFTTNTITNGGWAGAQVSRYNLDQIASCQQAGGNSFTWTGSVGQVVWTPARSTTDTMYLVTIEDASDLRYFWWPESGSSIFWTGPVGVESSNFGTATCTGGTSGNNWMGDPLSTSGIGFQVRTTVAQDNGTPYLATYYTVAANGGHPQAYSAGVITRTPDLTVLALPDIWNGSACFGFPDVSANARGDIGLSIGFGSSSSGGGPVQGYVAISDDYSRSGLSGFFGSVFLATAADDNPSRYGDYLTTRVEDPADLTFLATSYSLNFGQVNVRVGEFMRGRYAQAWIDRRLK
jgi:hypothetical protein